MVESIKSIEHASQNLGRKNTLGLLWLIFVVILGALTVNAQPVSGERPKPTTNKPVAVSVDESSTTLFQVCATEAPDVSYLIPEHDQFGGRTEASGSGAYAYKSTGRCPYWVVDFNMNRFSNTRVNESGMVIRENVNFHGDAFDLPSSAYASGQRPVIEEDCKRLEVDMLMFRKDPNENTFKMIKTGRGRFASWNSAGRVCTVSALGMHTEIAPTSNMLKIRIAVRVKLRGSWQQAAAFATLAPPN